MTQGPQNSPVYLDFNATTPVDPRIAEVVMHYMCEEYGNAGSRTHEHGTRAKRAVEAARDLVAGEVTAGRNEVVFTSGATESNNLAILGLAEYGRKSGRRHILSTAIEHKSVLEPCQHLEREGFQVSYIAPNTSGRIDVADLARELRPDTLLVSVMHANNETGVIQPIQEIVDLMADYEAFLHVDAAQTFCKLPVTLGSNRIDLISVSGHKVFAPKGVGALIARNERGVRSRLRPLIYGGGQEQGLRPGTVPVPLVAGLGKACELAKGQHQKWYDNMARTKAAILLALDVIPHRIIGDPDNSLPNCVNVCFPGVDSDALFVSLATNLSLSNGSACTSASYEPSYVLKSMGLEDKEIASSIRISWTAGMNPEILNPLIEAVLVFT